MIDRIFRFTDAALAAQNPNLWIYLTLAALVALAVAAYSIKAIYQLDRNSVK